MSLKNLSVIDGDPWSQDFPFDLLTFLEACQVWEAWPVAVTKKGAQFMIEKQTYKQGITFIFSTFSFIHTLEN